MMVSLSSGLLQAPSAFLPEIADALLRHLRLFLSSQEYPKATDANVYVRVASFPSATSFPSRARRCMAWSFLYFLDYTPTTFVQTRNG